MGQSARSALTPSAGAGGASAKRPRLADFAALYRPLLPALLGLVCARSGLIIANYGSYASTDEGIFTDGTMLFTIAVMVLLFLLSRTRKSHLTQRQEQLVMTASIALEALCVFVLALFALFDVRDVLSHFAVSAALTFFKSMAIFCWLRMAKDATCATAVVFTFGALSASEVFLYVVGLLPQEMQLLVAGVASCAQLPLMLAARKRTPMSQIPQLEGSEGFFGLTASMVEDARFLAMSALGIGLISIVDGLLRGYPDGMAIPFTAATRLGYGLLTIALALLLVRCVLRGYNHAISRWIWAVMELLACLALFFYVLFPSQLELGAVFTTTLNAMMVGFTWYIIIAFETHGWRDAFYYCFGAWIVWLGARSAARTALVFAYPLFPSALVMHALMSGLVVLSTIFIFIYFLSVSDSQLAGLEEKNGRLEQQLAQARGDAESLAASEAEAGGGKQKKAPALSGILGIDNHNAPARQAQSGADARMEAMKRSVAELGRQFLLSPREEEVLALYALGHTQKKVANELFITESTAHAHIKHIYEKTGMHSRQEILNYLERYTS